MGAKFKVPFPLLSAHDHSKPIGEVTKATATPNGIEIEAQLAPEGVQEYIDNAWKLIKSGLMKGLSIGFRALTAPESKGGNRVFNQYEVYELSVCTVPMNAGASITFAKSNENHNQENNMIHNQILKAISKDWTPEVIRNVEQRLVTKAEGPVPAATLANNPSLYYPGQSNDILLPPQTVAIITQLAQAGALTVPPNVRVLSQASLLSAGIVAEGAPTPAAAPGLAFTLANTANKAALILGFNAELLAASNFTGAVQAYVQNQLDSAASNGADQWFITKAIADGTAVSVTAATQSSFVTAIDAFVGDIRRAIWVGSPTTFTGLRDAANLQLGPNGGVFMGLPALSSLAMPANKLLLIDRSRVAIYDGPSTIEKSEEANVVFDNAPGSAVEAPLSMFQNHMVALKVVRYFDAAFLNAPLVVTLA